MFVFVIAHFGSVMSLLPSIVVGPRKEGRMEAGRVISFILVASVKPCEVLVPPLLSY